MPKASGFFLPLQVEQLQINRVVLGPVLSNFESTQVVSKCRAACQWPTLLQSEQQGAAIGIAAAGRIDQRCGLDRRNKRSVCVHPNFTAFAAQSDNQPAPPTRNFGTAPTGTITEHLAFIVIDGDPARLLHKGP